MVPEKKNNEIKIVLLKRLSKCKHKMFAIDSHGSCVL